MADCCNNVQLEPSLLTANVQEIGNRNQANRAAMHNNVFPSN